MSAPIVTTISGTGATYSQSITTVSTDGHWTPVATYTTVNNSPGTGKASAITVIVYSPLVSTFSIELGALGSPLSTLTPSTSTLSTSTLSTSTLSTSTSSTLNSSPSPLTTSFVSSGPSNSSTSVVVVPLTSTPASNSSSTQTGTPSPNSSSDTGAIAGAAVGCFIGGALIAGLLVWLFMSSRRKKKYRSSGGGFASQRQAPHGGSEKPLPLVAGAPVGLSGNWEKHLDQPESDATVTRSVKGLFDHIEVHVENFYRDANIPVTPELQAQLMKVDSHHLPDSVAGLLPQSQRPTLLIKHCIAQSIVEHISADSEIPDSFLPSDFIALPQALGARNSTGDKPAYNQAYSRWRVLSSYLRPKPTEDASYTAQRDAHITDLADTLSRTFDPWALSRDSYGSRRDNLVNIMRKGSETGMLLFSQPSTFRWRWQLSASKAQQGGKLNVVLLPGLEKTRDENANELGRPLELLRPVVGAVVG